MGSFASNATTAKPVYKVKNLSDTFDSLVSPTRHSPALVPPSLFILLLYLGMCS